MSHRKRVRTIESFFASNQSQTESEKNDTGDEQCINQEVTDEDQRKPKKLLRDHTWLHYEKETMFCYFVGNLIRQTPLHRQKGKPLRFGLEPTEELVDECVPVIKKGIAVFKEMPK